ncbi:helix-turn-helix domain-containing protein [Halobacterium sp. KA-4]|uniref:bacterio-opsin activator domain-containing protein n=1 Tax=Halobacterium sp. KA-4 TaxID=2896367 RepID=UPI001E629328|nr:bacterio-opsin activator domain-containing protein [Halobacterium sp. KA-4]MCD2200430.1 helix-turn-helix domain-containing protein [Halobacterium sp. KA-4]
MDDRLQQAPIGVLEIEADGTLREINAAARDLLDVNGSVAGEPLADVYPQSVEDTLPRLLDADEITAAEFEEYYPAIDGWLAVSIVPVETEATVYVQDVTARQSHAQTAEQLRAERTRATIVDELIADVVTKLVNAQSRDAILEAICEAFGETDLYEFAWVGDRDPGHDTLAVQAVAGDTGQTFAAVRDTIGSGEQTPEERAIERTQVEVVHPLAEATHVPERIRRAGFADGIQSLVAIPLVHGADSHGVVGVYASHATAFSERERTTFEALGEIAGFAVTATRNRNLLHADSVTEVTFEVDDSVLAALSAATKTTITVNGIVPHEEAIHGYLSIAGAAPDTVAAATRELDGLNNPRVVRAADSGGTIEVTITESTLLLIAASFGATVQQAVFEDGTGRVVVDLPQDGELRRFARVASREVDADVAAKRQRDTTPGVRARDVREELTERLTDRQETVLRTAYLADYFESPRGSTAEEVAASLDITGSTLLHHLRASQRKLLDAVFDDYD